MPEGNVLIKNRQINKLILFNILAFYRKYSDVTPFIIVNIFIGNCNLITHFFLVTVSDSSYIYFVIKLHNAITCNWLLPNTGVAYILQLPSCRNVCHPHTYKRTAVSKCTSHLLWAVPPTTITTLGDFYRSAFLLCKVCKAPQVKPPLTR